MTAAGTLTTAIRRDIQRHMRVAGGISRGHASLLFAHIDRLTELVSEAMTEGPEWGDPEWSVFIDAAYPLVDGLTVRRAGDAAPGAPEAGRDTP